MISPAIRMWLNRDKVEEKRVKKWLKRKKTVDSQSEHRDTRVSIQINRCTLAQIWSACRKDTSCTVESTLESAICLYLHSKQPKINPETSFSWEMFMEDLQRITGGGVDGGKAGQFYENMAYDFREPDLEDIEVEDILKRELEPESDKSWYDIDGEQLQKELEENMKSLGTDLTNDFSEILKLPDSVKTFISEQKPVSEPLDIDTTKIVGHVRRILTTDDFTTDEQAEIDSLLTNDPYTAPDDTESVNLVENLLKSISSEVGADSGAASALAKSVGIQLP